MTNNADITRRMKHIVYYKYFLLIGSLCILGVCVREYIVGYKLFAYLVTPITIFDYIFLTIVMNKILTKLKKDLENDNG